MKKYTDLRIAIVHDNIHHFGGAERALFALLELFPKAQFFTSTIWWDNLGKDRKKVEKFHPITSWIQRIPLMAKYPILYRYLLPLVWGSLDFSNYDLVISSSGAQISHLITVPKGTVHICYCHTPPRHLYGYATDFDWQKNPFIRAIAGLLNGYLRYIVLNSARKVNYFIANSQEVKKRIKKFYGRDSIVIYPPVSIPQPGKLMIKSGNYFLSVSRLSRMKHVDIIIKACKELNLPLKIVGSGPEGKNLKLLKSQNIEFLGKVSDETLNKLYSNCKAIICAAEDEDFGIVPIEAMRLGKPVIAYYSGGYKESIIKDKTGVFFYHMNVKSVERAINTFKDRKWLSNNLFRQADKFSNSVFSIRLRKLIEKTIYHENSLS